MSKYKFQDGRKSSKSHKNKKELNLQDQKIELSKKQNIELINAKKRLSLSFYNQQTLFGSKKIMLDLLPVHAIQAEQIYTPDYGVIQQSKFRSWSKKKLAKSGKKNICGKQCNQYFLPSDKKQRKQKSLKGCILQKQKKSESLNSQSMKKILKKLRLRLSCQQIKKEQRDKGKNLSVIKIQNYLHRYIKTIKEN